MKWDAGRHILKIEYLLGVVLVYIPEDDLTIEAAGHDQLALNEATPEIFLNLPRQVDNIVFMLPVLLQRDWFDELVELGDVVLILFLELFQVCAGSIWDVVFWWLFYEIAYSFAPGSYKICKKDKNTYKVLCLFSGFRVLSLFFPSYFSTDLS